jgi:hypothetical protein
MARKLVVLLAVGLVLAPAASAKGPHVVLTSGPEGVKPGEPWVATLELNEFRRQPHPIVVASRGGRRITAQLRSVPASMVGAASFKLRMVFPTEGRWRLAVVAAKLRFAFPPVGVGSGQVPQDYVSFPKGSAAARQGAGGVWTQGPDAEPTAPAGGSALPPEVVSVTEPEDDHGFPFWIPALGLAIAGAGVGLGVAHRR